MTFDDGILTVYEATNAAEAGKKPVMKLTEKRKTFFRYQTVGANRFYTAMAAHVQLEHVVTVPDWQDIEPVDIIVIDGKQYRIAQVQRTWDERNLKILRLSLERITEAYEYAE